VLVVATGLQMPNIPADIDGIEHTIGYESLPRTGETFEGQSVAVLGLGNAAFETGNALAPYVNYVHLWASRIPADLTGNGGTTDRNDFVAWESRYVVRVRVFR
jgi:cation diffusion facilitator CzcD-associated flavoprotein CzcO